MIGGDLQRARRDPDRRVRGTDAVGPVEAASRAVRHLRRHGDGDRHVRVALDPRHVRRHHPLDRPAVHAGPARVRRVDGLHRMPADVTERGRSHRDAVGPSDAHQRVGGRPRARRSRSSRSSTTPGDRRALSRRRSSCCSALGIAARILSNQTASTTAHRETREALEERERALLETDQALERVREANETLRQSEEHLRLVFETAEDGIVELDERGVGAARERGVRRDGRPATRIDRGPAVDGASPRWSSAPTTAFARHARRAGSRRSRGPTGRCCTSSRAPRRCRPPRRGPCCSCAT